MEYVYVDTGALYRTIAYYVISCGIDVKDEAAVVSCLDKIKIELKYIGGAQHVMLGTEDVSDKIRTPEISMGASAVSAIPKVREFLFGLQQDIAKHNNIIMDGRDIGTVVLPNAQVKIFLTAAAEERANRRFKELQEKGDPSTYEQVLEDIKQRDYNDTHRDIAPLKKADDAIEVDSTNMTLDEVISTIVKIIEDKTAGEGGGDDGEKKASVRATRELMPVRPISKKKKLTFIKLFFYNILRYITIFVYHCYYNIKWEGKENVPKDGGNIFASNHRSYQDPVFIAIHTRTPLSYMAKEELFRIPVISWILHQCHTFPVKRGAADRSAIKTAAKVLKEGHCIALFPEGTRSRSGRMRKAEPGVALIAKLSGAVVIPAAISGSDRILNKGCFLPKLKLSFGTPMKYTAEKADKESLHEFAQSVMDEVAKIKEEIEKR